MIRNTKNDWPTENFPIKNNQTQDVKNKRNASISVFVFIIATVFIVLFGSFDSFRPSYLIDGETVILDMPSIIEILMLTAAALILMLTKTNGLKAAQGSDVLRRHAGRCRNFRYRVDGDTFLQGNMTELKSSIEGIVTQMPWLFGIALFCHVYFAL